MLSSSLQRRQKVLDSGPSCSPGLGNLGCPAQGELPAGTGAGGGLRVPSQPRVPRRRVLRGDRLLSGERRAQGSWVASAFSSAEPRGCVGVTGAAASQPRSSEAPPAPWGRELGWSSTHSPLGALFIIKAPPRHQRES